MRQAFNTIFFIVLVVISVLIFSDYIDLSVIPYLSLVLTLSVIFISFVIFLENRRPTQTVAWIAVLASVPLLGFFFYIMFGRNYRKERMFRKKYYKDLKTKAEVESSYLASNEFGKTFIGKERVLHLASEIGESPISLASYTEVLTNGEITFSAIKEKLQSAEHHIHLEYYIFRHDQIGRELKEILVEKAMNGVEIRLLLDDVGCYKLSRSYIKELEEKGVQVAFFNTVHLPILNSKINFRNHRKIIIVDGKVGFVGGLNVGDEYLGMNKDFGFWRDTHLKVEGEAVDTLQLIFLQDWHYATKDTLQPQQYILKNTENIKKSGGVQILAGGPDNQVSVIKDIFFSMITSAQKSIWIASPYFIPDEDISSALKIAAKSGVDVRILVPSKPDHRIVFYASRSYFPEFLDAGVKIFEYKNGFMHSKIMITDGEIASIGTANMDLRSFHLNFEVNAFLYRTDSIAHLEKDYLADMEVSHQIVAEEFAKRGFLMKCYESLVRLMSPLL